MKSDPTINNLRQLLNRKVARAIEAQEDLIHSIQQRGLVHTMGWSARGALELGMHGDLAAYVLSALDGDNETKKKATLAEIKKYALGAVLMGVRHLEGGQSTNIMDVPERTSRAAFWAEIVSFIEEAA